MERDYTTFGYRGSEIWFHWGVTNRHDTPVTGVVSQHSLEWIWEEEYIDLTYEECYSDLDNHADDCAARQSDDTDDCDCDVFDFWEPWSSTWLFGQWARGEDGLYDAAPDCEYAAIYSSDSGNLQVIKSRYVARCNVCSPCYPGQCDLDSSGTYLAYDLPMGLYGTFYPRENVMTAQKSFLWGTLLVKRGDTARIEVIEHNMGALWYRVIFEVYFEDGTSREEDVMSMNDLSLGVLLRLMGYDDGDADLIVANVLREYRAQTA